MKTANHVRILGSHFNEMEQFKQNVLMGLSLPAKQLSSIYCYDRMGSEIFRKLIQADHNTLRCEAEILTSYQDHLLLYLDNGLFNLIELGSGALANSTILIENFLQNALSFTYNAIDTSKEYLELITEEIHLKYPQLKCNAIHAENIPGLHFVPHLANQRNIVLLLGSNLGYMAIDEMTAFLKQLRRSLNSGDYLLLGFDLRKNKENSIHDFNDPQGLYTVFYLNLLERINRELGGNFVINQFKYVANYNHDTESIDSFLMSDQHQTVRIDSLQQSIEFQKNELIYLSSAYKYREQQIYTLADAAGFEVSQMFIDDNRYMDSLWKINK